MYELQILLVDIHSDVCATATAVPTASMQLTASTVNIVSKNNSEFIWYFKIALDDL